jgi:hypothetical protein
MFLLVQVARSTSLSELVTYALQAYAIATLLLGHGLIEQFRISCTGFGIQEIMNRGLHEARSPQFGYLDPGNDMEADLLAIVKSCRGFICIS